MQKPISSELINFGEIVKKARLKKGLTQLELSVGINKDFRTMQRTEKGECNITFTNFHTLIEVLNIDPRAVWKNW